MSRTTWLAAALACGTVACTTNNVTNVIEATDGSGGAEDAGREQDAFDAWLMGPDAPLADAGGDAVDAFTCEWPNEAGGYSPGDGCFALPSRGSTGGGQIAPGACDGVCGASEYVCPTYTLPPAGRCAYSLSPAPAHQVVICCDALACTMLPHDPSGLCGQIDGGGYPVAHTCPNDADGVLLKPGLACILTSGYALGPIWCCES